MNEGIIKMTLKCSEYEFEIEFIFVLAHAKYEPDFK